MANAVCAQVLWGPLSFLTAYLIVTSSAYRHPFQALVSTGQFYGDLLYYTTSMFDDYFRGLRYYRPEPYYFWTYYFVMNAFWIIIPGRKCFPCVSLFYPFQREGCVADGCCGSMCV